MKHLLLMGGLRYTLNVLLVPRIHQKPTSRSRTSRSPVQYSIINLLL